jgi:hypothetical protein
LQRRATSGTVRAVANEPQRIVDAEYEVVGGPYRVGEEHRREKGWYFTGKYDRDGHPYFIRSARWFRWRGRMWALLYIALCLAPGLIIYAWELVAARR